MSTEGMIVEQQSSSANNVLFEPTFYQPDIDDDKMEETNTNFSMNQSTTGSVLDPSIFAAHKVRCCMCGIMMLPNESNTCINCLKSSIDVTEGITKSINLSHCRECNRYLRPPWQSAELESPELLSLCLKNIKGLKRVKLIDAGFLYTEPHSRRLKVKLTVQKEVLNGTLLQQSFVVEFVVNNLQCDDCKKTYTPHTWIAQAQIRQRVTHKRTFLFLEQLIIKHNAAEKSLGIKEMHDGLDFQFKNRSHANRLVDFISGTVPTKVKTAKQLVSHDLRNNVFSFKYTFSVEIAPICRDDLAVLSKPLSQLLGGIGPLVLVYKISTFVHIVDVFTMQTYEIDQAMYWKHEFSALCGRDRLTEFVVLNIENTDFDVNISRAAAKQKFKMVQVEVARKSDFGNNDRTFIINTHLGETLNYNDTVLGFDLEMINLNELEEHELTKTLPSVVLVRKTYPRFRKRQKHRLWKLKHLEKQGLTDENIHGHKKKKEKTDQGKHQKDYDMFLQDIEEDPELRPQIDLYRNDDIIKQLESKLAGMDLNKPVEEEVKEVAKPSTDPKNERKTVKVVRKTKEGKEKQEESEQQRKKNQALIKASMKEKSEVKHGSDDGSDWDSVEEDYQHIQLDELKTLEDQLAGMQIHGDDVNDEEDDDSDKEEAKKPKKSKK